MRKQLTVILLSALMLSGCASGRMGNPGAIVGGAAIGGSLGSIIRKSKFPWFPERSVQFSGKRTKRSVQKKGCTQHL